MKKLNFLIMFILLSFYFFAVSPLSVQAKLLPRFLSSGSSPSTKTISTRSYSGVGVSPHFLPGRYGIRVSFSNLQNAVSVNYIFTYESEGEQQGVQGTLSPGEGTSTSRDLLFGTCSSGTCVSRLAVKNAKLEVTSQLTSGKTSVKRYKIKV